MKRSISVIIITIICILNLFGVLYFLNQNKEGLIELTKTTQSRELYSVNKNINEETKIEDFIKYIKSLKVSSNQSWHVYDIENSCFLLYKDGPGEYIDTELKKYFTNFKEDYTSNKFKDSNNNEILLTIKKVEIDSKSYLVGISEYTTSIYKIIKNNNLNIYILGETILLSLLAIILTISYILKLISTDKRIEKLQRNFDDYKKRYTENVNEVIIEKPVESKPQSIKDEDGNYTILLLDMVIPKFKEHNIRYNIFEISDDKFWIIDEFFKENCYKIKKNKDNSIILLVEGNEKQIKLLKEFATTEVLNV